MVVVVSVTDAFRPEDGLLYRAPIAMTDLGNHRSFWTPRRGRTLGVAAGSCCQKSDRIRLDNRQGCNKVHNLAEPMRGGKTLLVTLWFFWDYKEDRN